ncbi:VOC family protein [Shewanella sp. 202IG2-18]|uniref:VOC family protein n=1 Tax=Parashewanella hymeniacidonis TaxID=2807618 RepID=UPI00195F2666|nr:VOC family protein [Parashewanella hymeniacidonis]MBM7074197.1 VOC family protein [Parashewanella hymeniacidonis]
MSQHEKLNYVELPSQNLSATKSFFHSVFDWEFVDYGDEYSAFSNQGIDGGFYQADHANTTEAGGALLVFYSDDIQATQDKVTANGGEIIRPVFEFPGGCRFHFTEPSGNEFAVWSQT